MSLITDFYNDRGVCCSGHSRTQVLAFSDKEWNSNHVFIQWLFPSDQPSAFSTTAPLLTEEDVFVFRSNMKIRYNVYASVQRFMEFLGFQDPDCVQPFWWCDVDHNHLRITRMLRFLKRCGFEDCIQDIKTRILTLDANFPDVVSNQTYLFWNEILFDEKMEPFPFLDLVIE